MGSSTRTNDTPSLIALDLRNNECITECTDKLWGQCPQIADHTQTVFRSKELLTTWLYTMPSFIRANPSCYLLSDPRRI